MAYIQLEAFSDRAVVNNVAVILPVAVDDAYDVTSGTPLVVPALTGTLANDTYET